MRPVWRDARFDRLWAGAVISAIGSSVTTLALPLTAVQLLAATPAQMGVLGASDTAAFLVFGLAAGVAADRMRRRTILLFTSLASSAVVLLVPLAQLAGVLRIEMLYVVAFVAGSLLLIDQVAFQAILPRLVGRDRVLETVTLVRSGDAVTGIIGPSLGGLLVQLLTAPIAIVVDAASFVVQAALTFTVRVDEPPAPARAAGGGIRRDVVEGLRYVFSEPSLRGLALGGATHNFFSNGAIVALYVLYATQVLGLAPVEIGIAFAAGGPSAIIGSAVAGRYGRRFGMRGTLAQTQVLTGLARVFVPLAAFSPSPLAALVVGEFVLGIARSIANVNQLSMRLALTPDHLQGRMTASIRFLMWSVVPFGALAGGVAAQRFGLVPTLVVAVVGTFLSAAGYLLIPRETTAS
ncbi:MAG TPA: MFS transporter [Candidatus Acidoferrales bacterium]|nr:MFS transporter [Candidatus Acidoferrales bacterium]